MRKKTTQSKRPESQRGRTSSKKPPSKAELQHIKDRIIYLRQEEYRYILERDELKKKIREETAWLKDLNNSLELKERRIRDTESEHKKYETDVKKRGITGKMLGISL